MSLSYRNPNRSVASNDDAKDLKSNMRESRLIQEEHWELPEIQEKFKQVRKSNRIRPT